jgi:hypothetical protein
MSWFASRDKGWRERELGRSFPPVLSMRGRGGEREILTGGLFLPSCTRRFFLRITQLLRIFHVETLKIFTSAHEY